MASMQVASPKLIPSTRFILALMVSFALFIQYAQRVSLSIGIVCMVNRTSANKELNTSSSRARSDINETISTVPENKFQLLQDKRLFLTEFDQQILLGAHWFGYLLTLAPGGWLSVQAGAKRTFGYGLLVSSVATLAMAGIYFLQSNELIFAVIFRTIAGIGHGPLFPATYTLWSMWAVPLERGTLTSIGFCSGNIGTSFTMFIGGIFCRYINSGWIYIYLLCGMLGFIWLPLWIWHVADSPHSHRSISDHEKTYICEHIGINVNDRKKRPVSITSVPWRRVLRSRAIVALIITHFCNLSGLFFFYTNIGKLLNEIHRIPAQQAGYVLTGGYILMPIVSLSVGVFADRLARSKTMSLTAVRKLFNSLTSYIPAVCMIGLCFCDHSRHILGITMVVLFLAGSAISYGSGYVVVFADIAPAYSSVIFAASSALGTVGALLSNLIAGLIIKEPVLDDWRRLLLIFAVVYAIGGTVFLLFGSAVPRKWATFSDNKLKNDEEGDVLSTLTFQSDVPIIDNDIESS